MENENITGEQLEIKTPQTGEVEDTNKMVEEKSSGSLDKFKDADTLLTAYNNLQAEFTRKCQRLSDLEKQTAEHAKLALEKETEESTPLYERENWSEIVAEFLSENEDAKAYSKEICDEIMTNKEQYSSLSSLEKAYTTVLKRHMVDKSEIANDMEFIDNYILSSEQIRQKVMKIYLDEMSKSSAPKVMSANLGTAPVRSVVAPKNLEEAKQIVKNLIEN